MRFRMFVAATIVFSVSTSFALADKVIDRGNVVREGTIKTIDQRGVVLLWSLTNGERAFKLEQIKSISIDNVRELEDAEEALADGRGARALALYEAAIRKSGKPWVKEYASARMVQAHAADGKLSESVKAYTRLVESGSHLAGQIGQPELGDPKGVEADKALALIDGTLAASGTRAEFQWLIQLKGALVEARKAAETPETVAPETAVAPAPAGPDVVAVAGAPAAPGIELFPRVEGRMSPVPPNEPVADEVVGLFKEFFAADVKRVLESADFVENVAVARNLYDAAERRASHAPFAAYVLDHVIYLASVSPDGLSLVYEALSVQYSNNMRSPAACLDKMMEISPGLIAALKAEDRARFITERLAADVESWFVIQREAGKFEGALAVAAKLQTACEAHLEGLPGALSDKLTQIEAVCGYQLAVQHCLSRVGAEGEFPKENLFVGIHALTMEQDWVKAAAYLQKSDNKEGLQLAECLAGAAAKMSAAADLETAVAIASLAESYDYDISTAMLWREAVVWLSKAKGSGKLSDVDALRADMLMERYQLQVASTRDNVPVLLAKAPPAATTATGTTAAVPATPAAAAGHTFFGISTKGPQSVVFVVDRSGSMTDSFMYVKSELVRSISELTEADQFHVIFYSSGPGVEAPARKLVSATAANKSAVIDFVNSLDPLGQTDPSDALDKAFRLKPKTIHLLTDGEFDPSITPLIARTNRDKKTVVNTICFLYTMGEEMCMKIAAENGGVYKFVGIEQVKPADPAPTRSARRGGATTTATPAIPPPPPPPPLPAGPPLSPDDLVRLERMIGVLEDRQVCQACKGNPETVKRETMPADLWGRRRIVTTTVVCSSCKGTGKTSASAMRETLNMVRSMLSKHGSSVPADVRHRATQAMSTYK